MLRLFTVLLISVSLIKAADTADEKAVVSTVQKLLDAMASHDGAAIRAAALPDARIVAANAEKDTVSSSTFEEFATRIGGSTSQLLERMWNPKVMTSSHVAMLWAEYDLHRDGKFHHCGVDVVGLVKTAEGWKISSLQYTMKITGCQPSPLGPPK